MRFLHALLVALFVAASIPAANGAPDIADKYDVVVAGAGTGGCAAAIQAARMGASVLLLDETDYIGGQMNAASVTSMDEGTLHLRSSGLYRELCQRIEAHYHKLAINCETAYWHRHICTEPRVGQQILRDMLAAPLNSGKLHLLTRATVIKVQKDQNTVTGVAIRFHQAGQDHDRTIACKILIDATEWGDVIPLTGARYRVGNCLSDNIDPARKIQMATWTAVYKEYPQGAPAELVMKDPPPGYTPKIAAYFDKTLIPGDKVNVKDRPWTIPTFLGYRAMPDSTRKNLPRAVTRTHLNYNNDYPLTVADVEDLSSRQATCRDAQLKTLQLLYHLQTAMKMEKWAIANDEGFDTPYNIQRVDRWIKDKPELAPYRSILIHFSIMPYARESRRIVGLHTLTARELDRRDKGPVRFPTCIALGDYAVDLHGASNAESLEAGLDRPEDKPEHGQWRTGLFTIPFESFIPETLDGFIPAEKNISQSRLANGATRLQPSTLLMGQAAGAIAALSLKHNLPARKLDPVLVQQALLDAGVMLFMVPLKDVSRDAKEWQAIQLACVHGVMSADTGKFQPDQPLTAAQLAIALEKLIGRAPANLTGDTTISRAAFAMSLTGVLSNEKVTLQFTADPADAAKPITRSEAAQILAELLILRAQARTTGRPQTIAWNAIRPVTPPARGDLSSPILPQLQRLAAAGIIDSVDYWLQNAVEGGKCDGVKVAAVIAKGAKLLSPDSKPDDAVKVLVEHRVVSSLEYWTKSAVPGAQCAGNNVAVLLRGLAQHTLPLLK